MFKASRFKITYIMQEIGLERAAFYARLKAKNWEPHHLTKFAEILGRENGGQ